MNIVLYHPFADVSLPLWVVVSQWVLLLALGFLVIVAYRQFGYMMYLKDKGSEHDGLDIGEQAPSFIYTPAHQNGRPTHHFDPKGGWSLLLFADPGCVSCRIALQGLEGVIPELPREMRVLVVTSSEPTLIDA